MWLNMEEYQMVGIKTYTFLEETEIGLPLISCFWFLYARQRRNR